MDWTYDLIGPELERFVTAERRVEYNLKKARDYWQSQLDKGRISEREADVINGLIQSVDTYQETTHGLLEGIGWMYNTLGISPDDIKRLKAKIFELELILDKYRVCRDPSLHPYVKMSDFR